MQLKRYRVVLLFAFIPLVLAIRHPEFSKQVQNISLTVMKPFLTVGHEAKKAVSETAHAVIKFRKAFSEQDANARKVAELEARLSRFQELEKENERLRKLLDFSRSLMKPSIAAEILGWDNSVWRHAAILDKGSKHGLQDNMAVVVAEGLVGRIFQVSHLSSRMILLLDPDSRVSALTADSRSDGVVSGDGSPTLKFKYLDIDSHIALGEEVLTSGRGSVYPKGIRIGKISAIHKDSDGLHLSAEVMPYANFKKIEEVLCLAGIPERKP